MSMYCPDRAAHRFSERDAVRHGSRTRDDVGFIHPVAVAVEGAVIDHNGTVADQGVGACRGVQDEPDLAPVPLQIVSDEGVPAREPCEYSSVPSAGHSVSAKGIVQHQQARESRVGRELDAVEVGSLEQIPCDDAHREGLGAERIGPWTYDRVVSDYNVRGAKHSNAALPRSAGWYRRNYRIPLYVGAVNRLGVGLQMNAREGRCRLKEAIVIHYRR